MVGARSTQGRAPAPGAFESHRCGYDAMTADCKMCFGRQQWRAPPPAQRQQYLCLLPCHIPLIVLRCFECLIFASSHLLKPPGPKPETQWKRSPELPLQSPCCSSSKARLLSRPLIEGSFGGLRGQAVQNGTGLLCRISSFCPRLGQ